MAKEAKHVQPGDPCPQCGGPFVPRAEGPQAAEKIEEKGPLFRCASCGYYARIK